MQVYYLATALAVKGIQSLVVTPDGSPLHKLLHDADIPVSGVRFAGDLDLSLVWKLAGIIRAYKPDIVHVHSRRGADTLGLVGWLCGGKHKGKLIVSRRVDDPLPASAITRWRYQQIPDRVIAVSQGIRRELIAAGIAPQQVEQVYSAIRFTDYQVAADRQELKAELGIDARHVVAVIAQLIERKGHRYLIQAAPEILQQNPDTAFLFIGDGELRAKLEAQVADAGLSNSFFFTGYREDVGRLLNLVDLLVHPATMEGFANVAMQAMAASIPVVSSAVGGMPESVIDGETGLLVPPRDSHALALAVNRLIGDEALRANLGDTGRKRVEANFSIERTLERTLEVYQSVLGAGR